MSTTIAVQSPAVTVNDPTPSPEYSQAVGNSVHVVEVSGVFVGSISEMMDLVEDNLLAASRIHEETEPMENVFSELGI